MSRYISIDDEVDLYLTKEVPKDEEGKREESWSNQLKRLLGIKKEFKNVGALLDNTMRVTECDPEDMKPEHKEMN